MNERLWSTRIRFPSRSRRPPKGSTSPPKSSPLSETAMALIVKSRRKRSSRIVACSTVGSDSVPDRLQPRQCGELVGEALLRAGPSLGRLPERPQDVTPGDDTHDSLVTDDCDPTCGRSGERNLQLGERRALARRRDARA